jgi:transcriptional regulator with XRE-family HTH domain
MRFCECLRYLRKQKELTWYRLAKLSGIPKQTLARLEQPTSNPTLAMLRRLAKALGVTVAELVEGETEKPKRTPKRQ